MNSYFWYYLFGIGENRELWQWAIHWLVCWTCESGIFIWGNKVWSFFCWKEQFVGSQLTKVRTKKCNLLSYPECATDA